LRRTFSTRCERVIALWPYESVGGRPSNEKVGSRGRELGNGEMTRGNPHQRPRPGPVQINGRIPLFTIAGNGETLRKRYQSRSSKNVGRKKNTGGKVPPAAGKGKLISPQTRSARKGYIDSVPGKNMTEIVKRELGKESNCQDYSWPLSSFWWGGTNWTWPHQTRDSSHTEHRGEGARGSA